MLFRSNDTATTEIYTPTTTLSLHDALPISGAEQDGQARVLALQVSGSPGLDWSPHRGYLLAQGDRLILLATRTGLTRFLSSR